MIFFTRTEDEPKKKLSFFERRAERRRQRRQEAEDDKIRECFKYLLPRSFPADAVSMVKNQVAMIISDLQISPDVTEEAPGLIGQYSQIEQALAVIIQKLNAADVRHEQALDVAEEKRVVAWKGEKVKEINESIKYPDFLAQKS
jgi:hypothetical protein